MRNRGSSRTIDNEKLEQVSADLDVTSGRRRDPCLKVERKKREEKKKIFIQRGRAIRKGK